jgi:hypothetical protein
MPTADDLCALAFQHLDSDRSPDCEACFRQVLAIDPDHVLARTQLADLLLSLGRWEEAWPLNRIYDDKTRPDGPPVPFPEWRGEPLAGKSILIWPRFGLGDQIMFARYIPILRDMGAQVTLIVLPMFGNVFDGLDCRVVHAANELVIPPQDFWVYSALIPNRLNQSLATVPPNTPYLQTSPLDCNLPVGPKVGLAWRGNPLHANDAERTFARSNFQVLEGLGAALISKMDLVISVDTSTVHLAGTLNKPCWVLLPKHRTDWRWLRGRSDTPWYSSLRLYRQAVRGEWAPVIDQVAIDLKAMLATAS